MKDLANIIKAKKLQRDHRNTYEYQAYGNRLAEELNDTGHRALYIKYAQTKDRNLLEQAREFVLGQEHITSKGKLFMWKLKQLENGLKTDEKVTAS